MSRKFTIYYLFFLTAFVVLMIWLCSCSSVKRVLSDPKKRDAVYKELEKEHPCINKDSLIKYLPGTEVIKYDTTTSFYTDTLIESGTQIKYVTKYVNVVKTVKKIDTVRYDIEDIRRINSLRQDNSFKDGRIEQQGIQIKDLTKEKNKWFWLFIGSVTLSVLVTAWKIYRKIKVGKL